VLLDAYARAARVWAKGNYDWPPEQQAAFASAVLRATGAGDGNILVEMATRLRGSPAALADFLGGLLVVATYEPDRATTLGEHWPALMDLGLETVRRADRKGRSQRAELIRKLVPSPSTGVTERDPEQVIVGARAHWPTLEAVEEHMDAWLGLALGEQLCVDQLVGFLQAQSVAHQVQPGLDWIRRLVVAEDGTARTSGFLLVGWLETLRGRNSLGHNDLPKYQAIVDALVLGNYRGARELQRRDE